VRLGRGNGTFEKPVHYPLPYGPTSIAIADFNGEGVPDLAVNRTNFIDISGQILLGNGDGTFRSGPSLPGGILSLVAADFNRDGKMDLGVGVSGGVWRCWNYVGEWRWHIPPLYSNTYRTIWFAGGRRFQ
jgi:hypothetical protein